MDHQNLSAPPCAPSSGNRRLVAAGYVRRAPHPQAEPSDLAVAVSVAQQLLDSDQILSVREALRLLLRAIGAEPREIRHANGSTFQVIDADSYDARMARDVRTLTMADGSEWTVGTRGAGSAIAWRPTTSQVPATPSTERCPAAHPEDPTGCNGPVAVTVLDRHNAGADGCEHHAARLLASLTGGRVYPLPATPGEAAIRVFKAADRTRPFPWLTDAPRTRDDQLSRAEVRERGERQ
ncbi:hypothetical protein [Streptomyces sp. NPDC088812]|uniref:hypothetical protein n=1 Tax=Streptomyces sp. NPDC088812 TaxID=3365905 RepID=UPI003828D83E